MGTRADFYKCMNPRNEDWIGSIAYDGYPSGRDLIESNIFSSKTLNEYLRNVVRFLNSEETASLRKDGWPWAWQTSRNTDYSYCFHDGFVWVSNWASDWVKVVEFGEEELDKLEFNLDSEKIKFPDMTEMQVVKTFGEVIES